MTVFLFAIALISRLIPHPANLTAMTAVAFLSPSLTQSKTSLAILFLAMLISDSLIGFYPGIFFTYLGFGLVTLMGALTLKHLRRKRALAFPFASSLVFYLVSNLGVFLTADMYPVSAQGIITCYVAALPFFFGDLIGNYLYSGVILTVVGIRKMKILSWFRRI